MTSHLVFQHPESCQFAQKMKIINLLGHTLYAFAQIPIKTLQPSTSILEAARLTQQVMENALRIRQTFEPPYIRHG